MRRLSVQIILGGLIVVAGVLLLLEATGTMTSPRIVWAVLLAAASAVFWFVFSADRSSWWAAIPGAALLGAALVVVMELDPQGLGQWTEVPFLALLGVGFWVVYFRDVDRWWAVIPAGVLLTLAIVAGLSSVADGPMIGAILLFGVAVTFALVALLPGGASRRRWAWIPAAAAALVAIVILFSAGRWFVLLNYVWPVLVIAAGVFVVWRAVGRGGHRADERELAGSDGPVSEDPRQ
ncbi:hypothetical protein BJ991_003530 [Microbacterium immunditiarum]|uniref:Uncharacterized protein n=2 Tax=Microbacterium immunditiarum TaxID=337480 RepID=A0A7Y9KJC4_9MICO|nr:hypothetical protein [Microbacterium immunditiarum]